MVKFELLAYGDADKILEEKNLLQEIKAILQNVKLVDHREIQTEFLNKRKKLEVYKLLT